MKRELLTLFSVCLLTGSVALADELADQTYVNQLNYRHNKLELTTKTRLVHESRSYSNTDIISTTYSYEAYSQTSTDITSSALNRSEQKEVTDWYIYKGGVQELSDLEFLDLIGDRSLYNQVHDNLDRSNIWQQLGHVTIGVGIATMIGGAALSADQPVITGGALVTVAGFFISAFSLPPKHYLKSSYALNKIDEYNINLKRQLNLPLNFE